MPGVRSTPVIIGIGIHRERTDDPRDTAEPYRLMVEAVRHARAVLGEIRKVQGMGQEVELAAIDCAPDILGEHAQKFGLR